MNIIILILEEIKVRRWGVLSRKVNRKIVDKFSMGIKVGFIILEK